jgi:O-antigen ligase
VFALLGAITIAAALAQAWACRAERTEPAGGRRLRYSSRLPALAGVAVVLALAGLVAAGLSQHRNPDDLSKRTGISRLGSADSRRYDYWRVALNSFADHPLRGVGAGGFRVEWVRERPVRDPALEAHSLPLEMLAELGVPGLIFLGLLAGGLAVAGRRALRVHPDLAPGACAGAAVFALHATIDWDWQLPAVTLPAIILGGALIAMAEDAGGAGATGATRAGSAV